MEKIRLQKYFTDCKIMSRRAAEAEIAAGKVTVNGAVAAVGDKVDPAADVVVWNGRTLQYPTGEHVYIMLHKPQGVVSASRDKKDTTVVDLVAADFPRRELFPAGRLTKPAPALCC